MAKTVGGRCDRAFVECIDSVDDAADVERVLEFATSRKFQWLAPAVLRLSELLELDLDSEALFPNFTAVWLAEPGPSAVAPPKFVTWMAGAGEAPTTSSRHPVGWDAVERWMVENGIVGGVASGELTLTILRLELVDQIASGTGCGPKPPGGGGSRGSAPNLLDASVVWHGRGAPPTTGGPPDGVGAVFRRGGELAKIRLWDGHGDLFLEIEWGHDHGAGDPHMHLWASPTDPGPGVPFLWHR